MYLFKMWPKMKASTSSRRKATDHEMCIRDSSCAVIGAFCSFSLGATDKLSWFGKTLFDWFDFITGQVFLPMAGLLTCLFLGWYVPKKILKDEFTNWGTLKGRLFGIYFFLIKFVCPILILLVFLNQFEVL